MECCLAHPQKSMSQRLETELVSTWMVMRTHPKGMNTCCIYSTEFRTYIGKTGSLPRATCFNLSVKYKSPESEPTKITGNLGTNNST